MPAQACRCAVSDCIVESGCVENAGYGNANTFCDTTTMLHCVPNIPSGYVKPIENNINVILFLLSLIISMELEITLTPILAMSYRH